MLKRNLTFIRTELGDWTYRPDYAQTYAKERGQAKKYFYKFTAEVETFVKEKLKHEESLEQISVYAKRWKLFSISREWIISTFWKINARVASYIIIYSCEPRNLNKDLAKAKVFMKLD